MQKISIFIIYILIFFFLLLSKDYSFGDDNLWEPWDNNVSKHSNNNYNNNSSAETTYLQYILLEAVSFFQDVISPVDGERCSMYPTCSAYSYNAIKKHGAIIGFFMTADRLLHEYGEQDYVPLIKKFGRYRFFDPIENNDFWFTKGSISSWYY